MDFKIKGETLSFDNVEVKIKGLKELDDYLVKDGFVYVVLTLSKAHHDINRNLWKLDNAGNILWKSEDIQPNVEKDRPFVSVRLVDNQIVAGNWIGLNFIVDEADGSCTLVPGQGRPW